MTRYRPGVIQIVELAGKDGKIAKLNIFHMFKTLTDVAPFVGHRPVHQKGCQSILVRAHAKIMGLISSWGCVEGNIYVTLSH